MDDGSGLLPWDLGRVHPRHTVWFMADGDTNEQDRDILRFLKDLLGSRTPHFRVPQRSAQRPDWGHSDWFMRGLPCDLDHGPFPALVQGYYLDLTPTERTLDAMPGTLYQCSHAWALILEYVFPSKIYRPARGHYIVGSDAGRSSILPEHLMWSSEHCLMDRITVSDSESPAPNPEPLQQSRGLSHNTTVASPVFPTSIDLLESAGTKVCSVDGIQLQRRMEWVLNRQFKNVIAFHRLNGRTSNRDAIQEWMIWDRISFARPCFGKLRGVDPLRDGLSSVVRHGRHHALTCVWITGGAQGEHISNAWTLPHDVADLVDWLVIPWSRRASLFGSQGRKFIANWFPHIPNLDLRTLIWLWVTLPQTYLVINRRPREFTLCETYFWWNS
jgi:hypothetical protein